MMAKKKNGLKARVRKAKKTAVATQSKLPASLTASPRFKKSLWSFWEDGCTQSLLRRFLECPEQCRLKFVEGWSSMSPKLALEFGSCIHWLLSQTCGKAKRPPGPKTLDNLLDQYWKLISREYPIRSQKSEDVFTRVFGLARAVMPQYLSRWSGDWTGKYNPKNPTVHPKRWLTLEERFKVPYKFPDGRQTVLQGMFDGVFEDARKRLWLFETKTKSVIDREAIEDLLPVDIQVMFYLWALRQVSGRTPHGVLYNVVRRPGLRQGKNEKLTDFFARCDADVSDVRRLDHYFMRWEMEVNESEIDDFMARTIAPVLSEIRRWWQGDGRHYMNPDRLITKYGRCDMYEPIVHGNFRGLKKRKVVFNELADSAV